jgi:hypothetical protein
MNRVWIERRVNNLTVLRRTGCPVAALSPHEVARHDGEPITVAESGPLGGKSA